MTQIEREPDDQIAHAMYDVLSTMGGTAAHTVVQGGMEQLQPEQRSAPELMIARGYAIAGRTLADCLADSEERTEPIRYWGTAIQRGEPLEMTESAALQQLDDFFRLSSAELAERYKGQEVMMHFSDLMARMRNDLFFIGKQEFDEAAAGIAALWTTYLTENPNLDLWVPYQTLSDATYLKSPQLLFKQVMTTISQSANIRGRIHGEKRFESRPGRETKIILLDDWSKAGLQMEDIINYLGLDELDDIEIHLAAASDWQIERGIKHRYYNPNQEPLIVPVRAYFHAGEDTAKREGTPMHGPLITGAHSTVDFDFHSKIDVVLRSLENATKPILQQLPALARLARTRRTPRQWAED